MGKIFTLTMVTLDGVIQAPAGVDEDSRDGFKHGGWAVPYAAMESVSEGMATTGAMLFGRQTYEGFYNFWPKQTDDNPFTGFLNNIPKYVASMTLKEALPWQNSTLLKGDIGDAVAKLKQDVDKDILILGSGVLIQSLMRHNLIDEYTLLIHPIVLGTGRKLFADDGALVTLNLVDSKMTSKGVIIATYQPA